MAASMLANPKSDDFHFQDLEVLGPLPALLFLPAGGPALTVGDIYTNNNFVRYSVEVNAGRIGYPAIELSIHSQADGHGQAARITFLIELGQASASSSSRYHLDRYEAEFLGRAGGGGTLYDHDAPQIRDICVRGRDVSLKKRILRLRINIYGVVASPGETSVTNFLSSLSPNHPARTLIDRLRNPGPHSNKKIPPLHQYTPVTQRLNLDMPDHQNFRHGMYYDRTTANSATLNFSNIRLLPDTKNRRLARLMAITLSAGVARESQADDRICQRVATPSTGHAMRLVQTLHPVLDRPVRLVSQSDNAIRGSRDSYGYIGYIDSFIPEPQGVRLGPRPGSVFGIKWTDGAQAYGVVQSVSQTHLQSTNTRFVLLACGVTTAVLNKASASITNARSEFVNLVHYPSKSYDQTQLDGLRRLETANLDENVQALQKITLLQPNQPLSKHINVQINGTAWNNALTELLTEIMRGNRLRGNQLPASEYRLLRDLTADMPYRMQLVQSTLADNTIRTVFILTLLLKAVGHNVVVVIENAEDRARVCSNLRRMQDLVRNGSNYGRQCADARMLAYTTHNIDTKNATDERERSVRRSIDLAAKYFDELPQTEWLTDRTNKYWSATSNVSPGGNGVPLDMSLGDHLQSDLQTVAVQVRRQHFADRQSILDNVNATDGAEIAAILTRYRRTVRATLANTHVLVTDCETAASEDVRTSIKAPVIVLLEAQGITQAQATSVLLANETQVAAFICGDGNNTRRPLRFASASTNEAFVSFSKSAWHFMQDAGTPAFVL